MRKEEIREYMEGLADGKEIVIPGIKEVNKEEKRSVRQSLAVIRERRISLKICSY